MRNRYVYKKDKRVHSNSRLKKKDNTCIKNSGSA
jgi:hypothetical protein